MNGEWNEIKIIVPKDLQEPVASILYGMDVKGISIEDPDDLYRAASYVLSQNIIHGDALTMQIKGGLPRTMGGLYLPLSSGLPAARAFC